MDEGQTRECSKTQPQEWYPHPRGEQSSDNNVWSNEIMFAYPVWSHLTRPENVPKGVQAGVERKWGDTYSPLHVDGVCWCVDHLLLRRREGRINPEHSEAERPDLVVFDSPLPVGANRIPLLDHFCSHSDSKVNWLMSDGAQINTSSSDTGKVVVAKVTGSCRHILQGERTALNVISRCSGVATATSEAVQQAKAKGWKGYVAGTRKTTPGDCVCEEELDLVHPCESQTMRQPCTYVAITFFGRTVVEL